MGLEDTFIESLQSFFREKRFGLACLKNSFQSISALGAINFQMWKLFPGHLVFGELLIFVAAP